jgi:site-specific DNA-methyltransferase (adenine-specific)
MNLNDLICGNNVDVLKGLDENSIDLTITSPPYDGLRDYNGYSFDFEGIAKQLYRITQSGGVVVWIVNDSTKNGTESGTSFRQALHFKEIGFKLHDTMIWYKTTAPLTHKRYEQEFEYMFIFVKGKIKTFNPIMVDKKYMDKRDKPMIRRERDNTIDYGTRSMNTTKIKGNMWSIPTGGGHNTKDKIAYQHPATFPEKLAEDHIISWSNEGDTVLDPFVGSGTTCKMAKQLGRKYIGVDISQEYIDITKQRLKLA